ncbi:hypothetical protein OG21DRAFT_779213 [Imleria badia]|nr:hypothetical protein OG21DRAFT_779213 [Imleria badia]
MFNINLRVGRPRSDDAYATPRAEARYWRVARRYRRRLYSGNGTTSAPSKASRDSTDIPLVTYYTPRLLPLYRDRSSGKRTSRETVMDAQEGRISPRTFCKWHRMVFQDSCHPTLAQAGMQMKYYSNRDLREIQRIARLLPDEQVFGPKGKGTRKAKGTTKFRAMWQSWLENKGMDLVIVFE